MSIDFYPILLCNLLRCHCMIKMSMCQKHSHRNNAILFDDLYDPRCIVTRINDQCFFRLSVFRIHLPSLRERPGDIAEYARFFAAQFADRMGRRIDTIDKGYIAALERHAWHGNVRELRNVVERSLIMAEGNALTVGCLSPEFHAASCDGSVPDSMALDALERHHILRVLEYTKGNKAEAARLLGIGIATLYRKLESYGMKP